MEMTGRSDEVVFHRLIGLLSEVGTETLLKLFLHKIPTNDLKSFLIAKGDNITSLLEGGLITLSDYYVLVREVPDASLLSISILFTLLCHVCEGITAPTAGWKKIPPLEDDKSIGAWLLRLKECRNEVLAFRDSMTIDKWQFKGIWKEIKKVLKNIAKTLGEGAFGNFEARVCEVEDRVIDPTTDQHVLNLHTMLRWYEQDVNQARDSLLKVNSSVSSEIEQHKKKASEGKDETDAVRRDCGDKASPDSSLQQDLTSLEQAFAHIKLEKTSIAGFAKSDLGSLQEIQDNIHQCRQQMDELQSQLRLLYDNLQAKASNITPDGSGHAQGTSLQTAVSEIPATAESRGQVLQQPSPHTIYTEEMVPQPVQRPSQAKGGAQTRSQPIPDTDLKKYSRFIGREWEMTGVSLGYADYQMNSLKAMYHQQPETRTFIMVKRWHDVVVSEGEKVRELLAKAFTEDNNNEAAEEIVGVHRLADIQKARIDCKPSTKEAIKQISFEVSSTRQSGRVNIGAPGSINIFPGSEAVFGGSLSIGSSGVENRQPDFSHQLGHLQHGSEVNVGGHGSLNVYNTRFETKPSSNITIGGIDDVRGEIFDSTDSALAANPPPSHSHELKKEFNDTLTQSQVLQLGELMKSVCAVIGPWGFGTAFRVGHRYLLTANHVIRDIKQDGIKLSSENVGVYFGEEVNTSYMNPNYFYRLTDNYCHDETLDIAILEIANPGENLPPPLHMAAVNIEGYMTTLSLIGYGNPDCDRTKHLDSSCAIVPQNSTLIKTAHAYLQKHSDSLKRALEKSLKDPNLVDLGYNGYDAAHNVIINCFSEKGASGGPIIDCRNPRLPRVVGVLTHGLPVCFWELNLPDQEKFPKCYRLEVGTRATAIKTFVENLVVQGMCSADVFNELFPL